MISDPTTQGVTLVLMTKGLSIVIERPSTAFPISHRDTVVGGQAVATATGEIRIIGLAITQVIYLVTVAEILPPVKQHKKRFHLVSFVQERVTINQGVKDLIYGNVASW